MTGVESSLPRERNGMPDGAHPVDLFALRPVRGATVSEISEATASSPVPPEERVNFHIGNPVQDQGLLELYARTALGLPTTASGEGDLAAALARELGVERAEEQRGIEFLLNLIGKSAPYLPRGGFLKHKPPELILLFRDWLTKQSEPLVYDLGETSGRRELILSGGGVTESLRVLFHALDSRLEHTPATVFSHGFGVPGHFRDFQNLRFRVLPEGEGEAVASLERFLAREEQQPCFLLLGDIPSEEARRTLRRLSRDYPLFLIEANDAPNHASLAREARMLNRTLRLLTPAVFSPRFAGLSVVFIAGYSAFTGIIETVHFQLKGTPSAAEVELLTYLVKHHAPAGGARPAVGDSLYAETAPGLPPAQNAATQAAARTGEAIARLTAARLSRAEQLATEAAKRFSRRLEHLARPSLAAIPAGDPMEGLSFQEILDALPARSEELLEGFRVSFLRHHPEYKPEATLVVSGSARTALSLLGFHCGIREVVIPDLSWTYEHCFPKVTSVPLTSGFQIHAQGILRETEARLRQDPKWRERGAVVINNPHNATGQVFDEESLRTLLGQLLERGVFVIDDLSYQNVAPSPHLSGPKTLRQIADELVRAGYVTDRQAERVITVHSLSKTDCLAGARLAVAEIREAGLRRRFAAINATIAPNVGAILAAYLFYRRSSQSTNTYWRLRNALLDERMTAIEQAVANLPAERNPYGITVTRPAGSMYPRLTLNHLPAGMSLDWIASGLALQGIGVVPLSTFAHTEEGVESGRRSFRLTLGGTDGADKLLVKTRRVLIDLNRIVAEEEARYNRRRVSLSAPPRTTAMNRAERQNEWARFRARVAAECREQAAREMRRLNGASRWRSAPEALEEFLTDRLELFQARCLDRLEIAEERRALAALGGGSKLEELLAEEFSADTIQRRQSLFRQRLYDRTVHPTQMYSIETELLWERAIEALSSGTPLPPLVKPLGWELAREFLGLNVAIDSRAEGKELLLDLTSLIAAEDVLRFRSPVSWRSFLSYWGDWDGSNRPSGQGHHLVATVLMENVARMGRLLTTLMEGEGQPRLGSRLIEEVRGLPASNRRFRGLLDEINSLTHQLERRYRGLLPFEVRPSIFRKLGMRLHVARDPVVRLYEHNDRLERKMLELRSKRREALRYYFELNQSLRQSLRENLPEFLKFSKNPRAAEAAAGFRDLLRRFVLTPRIHQNMVTSADPFAVDTTVHNIMEINELAGRCGSPGMVLALQVSMSSEAEALISLDRKMRARREEILRSTRSDLPSVAIVPLFEDVAVVRNLRGYLDKLWAYAIQSRALKQSPESRFSEMISEIFIAGSDLSQQAGQTAGRAAFREGKHEAVRWLAERGLVGEVRIKMGNGEPMQRQGGYYAQVSGLPAFHLTSENEQMLGRWVDASAKRSARYAATPLMGLLATGDLVTFQSNLSERLRALPAAEFAQLLHHVAEAQSFHTRELRRAAEPLTETRLQFTQRGLHELRRLTVGFQDELFDEFVKLATDNFRWILYGREEDVVGIYVISYFVARALPPLRDRPTVRPAPGPAAARGQKILERIAATVPFARHGSSLRAIAHNQAQTMLLGVNQLTTGLFRALSSFARLHGGEGEGGNVLASRVLPHLPAYEILHSLRLYQDVDLRWLWKLERAFPAGNSAFTTLREDADSLKTAVPLFQKELVRRHGLQVADFFDGDRFLPRLLPTLRPDLAVLLQPDLFNTDADRLFGEAGGSVSPGWGDEIRRLLRIPDQIRAWRESSWELLYEPVFSRVSMFVELATALHSVTQRTQSSEMFPASSKPKTLRDVSPLLRSAGEDSLQQFLSAALEYLSAIPRGSIELPTNVIRAVKEAERLVRIEEQALRSRQQDILRFCLLQIARAAGENG